MNLHLAQEPDDAHAWLSFVFPGKNAGLPLPTTESKIGEGELPTKNSGTHSNKTIQKANQLPTSSAIWFCNSALIVSRVSISALQMVKNIY